MGVILRRDDLICPYFVASGNGKEEISSLPGLFRFSPHSLLKEVARTRRYGIKKILLFGVPDRKDPSAWQAYRKDNLVARAVAEIKTAFSDVTVMTDVCLCAYTDHGHCGLIPAGRKKRDPQLTLEALSEMALSHAQAGADYVAPSAMVAGQVAVLRKALDRGGFAGTKIMGYSAKFASSFYGPFREAAGSAPRFGRRNYQLDYADTAAALSQVGRDLKEGADIVMVKPALGYLDVIKEVRQISPSPVAAYNVSGEYAFVKSAARSGWAKEKDLVFEILTAIKRAGADFIISYHAPEAARWLEKS